MEGKKEPDWKDRMLNDLAKKRIASLLNKGKHEGLTKEEVTELAKLLRLL